jgi:hypothetical protein
MKAKVVYGYKADEEYELSKFVSDELEGSGDRIGALEEVEIKTAHLVSAFSNLVDVLASKGLLDGEDIRKIVGTFQDIVLTQ